MSRYAASSWHVVVPVKGGARAKSRLHPPTGVSRGDLALAIAMDTLDVVCAAVAPQQVVVVTSDRTTERLGRDLGALLVRERGSGLTAAIETGLAHLRVLGAAGPTGVLLGDLPALQVEDLVTALDTAHHHERAFVPDADGTGTVLLTALRLADLQPSFGADSAARHARHSVRLDLDVPGLRRDVDDDASLRSAVALGVGPRTKHLLGRAALA